jgi:hypothetical protein
MRVHGKASEHIESSAKELGQMSGSSSHHTSTKFLKATLLYKVGPWTM